MEKEQKDLVPMELNLNEKVITESFLMMAGEVIKFLLKKMFGGGGSGSVSIKGTPKQIDAFSKTLAKEKKYMDNFYKYGLDDPKTYKSKTFLDKSIKNFEKATRIKWPFKK